MLEREREREKVDALLNMKKKLRGIEDWTTNVYFEGRRRETTIATFVLREKEEKLIDKWRE
mgnify:CR=1 FL=1